MKAAVQIIVGIAESVIGLLIIMGKLPVISIAWSWAIQGALVVLMLSIAGLAIAAARES